jgi:hypothetical protein
VVQYVGIDEGEARRRLAGIGTELIASDADEAEEAIIARVLPLADRGVRAEVGIEPALDPDAGMGAWHVNAQTEAHTVRSGRGLVEFWTPEGPVAAVISAGTVMVVRGGEHRYRALSTQTWAIRHTGDGAADLGSSETGRVSTGWPSLP